MRNLTIGSISEGELLELAKSIKLKNKLIAERKTIASNIKEKGRASCFISFFAHGFSRDLCEEQGGDTVGQLLQAASNKESEFILDRVYDSAISDLEIVISNYTDEQNSLIERKELTGSDLAVALLKKQRYIIASVSDESDDDAIECGDNRLIFNSDDDYFTDDMGGIHCYAVPLNFQGEPLTATDVGL